MPAVISIATHMKGPMPMALGRPILALMIERLARNRFGRVVVATTAEPIDGPVEAVARSMGAMCVRGADVAEQHALAMWLGHADIVCGCSASEPLLAPQPFNAMVERIRDRRMPVEFVRCGNAWAVTKQPLVDADLEATGDERANPALFWGRRATRYPTWVLPSGASQPWSVTTDTQDGLDRARRIFEMLYPRHPDFGIEDVIRLQDEHPELAPIPTGSDHADGRSGGTAIPAGVGPAPVRLLDWGEAE